MQSVFDAMPSLIFIVDDDLRIIECNAASTDFLGAKREAIVSRRCGDVLHCLHSTDVFEGCGRAPSCRHCITRDSVVKAAEGDRVVRRRAKMLMESEGEKVEWYALITASPFRFQDKPFVLLVVEDISEIAELRRLIPICSVCGKIRDEEESWSRLEAYFKRHWDVDFSHALCPQCYEDQMKAVGGGGEAEAGASGRAR
jgi:hypothetical protein